MHKRVPVDRIVRGMEEMQFETVEQLLDYVGKEVNGVLDKSEWETSPDRKEQLVRHVIWARIIRAMTNLEERVEVNKTLTVPPDIFSRAADHVHTLARASFETVQQDPSHAILFEAFQSVFPASHLLADKYSRQKRRKHDDPTRVTELLKNDAIGGARDELYKLSLRLMHFARDKAHFLELYDASYRYLMIAALGSIEHVIDFAPNWRQLYVDESGKPRHRQYDDREWLNANLNHSKDLPRSGCPAAISFEGMSMIKWLYDEYRKELEAIPASTYSSTSECEGL